MMTESNSPFRKWLQKCIKEKFEQEITYKLDEDVDIESIVDEIITTEDIKQLVQDSKNFVINAINKTNDKSVKINDKSDELGTGGSLLSANDLFNDDWSPFKPNSDDLPIILDNLSTKKPVHVRLAGFEALLDGELINNCSDEVFSGLITSLRDGISDNSRPIFESSLRVYSKLLDSSRSYDAYTNLVNIFDNEYYSKKISETLPNFNIGISFKIFLHEKLFRILFLIIKHQKRILKTMRTVDKTIEEMIDQFVVFVASQNVSNALTKTLNVLNFISVLEPQANWSKKWIHNFSSRKTFISALAKSPNLLGMVLDVVKKNLDNPPSVLTCSITDDPLNFFISSETIEALTYFHCLNFLAQLYSCVSGRNLLRDIQIDLPSSSEDFLFSLVGCLNNMASSSTASRVVYNETQQALKLILNQPTFPCDARLFHIALNHLLKSNINNGTNIWSHTVDILNFMLMSNEGFHFLTTDYRSNSAKIEHSKPNCPITIILINTSELLRQPFAVMDVQQLVRIFKFIENYFQVIEDFNIVEDAITKHFFPALEFFYHKLDKCSIGYENWTQSFDNAAKNMLLKVTANPSGLQLLSKCPSVFEELIRSSINPLRYSWSSNEIVSFICSAAFFEYAQRIIVALIPQTFSMFLTDVCSNLENPDLFFDPWNAENAKKFIHVIALLSLNTECFNIFIKDSKDGAAEDYEYPRSFCELLNYSLHGDSPFHSFSLLILENMIWNLDILINLLHLYDLQTQLLQLQRETVLEVRKYEEKLEDEMSEYEMEEEKDITKENEPLENQERHEIIEETHKVYEINESSFIRHRILVNSYYIKHKLNKKFQVPEQVKLFYTFPPPEEEIDTKKLMRLNSTSELDEFLNESGPGLRDSGWVSQLKRAYRSSQTSIKHSTLIHLLDQMEKAIPTVEWVDIFQWDNKLMTEYFWLPEEELGLELAIRYAEENCEELENPSEAKENLKKVFEMVHTYIKFEKMRKFEGFDWFLATIFVICNGDIEKCKQFISQLVRFPSAVFMWRALGSVVDQANEEEVATQIIVAQHIESIINIELPAISYALKNEFGIRWWIICDRLLTQCFWGILEWSEIMNFFKVCILNPPDYIVYYCVSLLEHCEPILMQDIIDKKFWPENLDLSQYRCHNYLGFMDRLAKKYQNSVLPALTQIKLINEE
ncbi:protein broad-minded-like [Chelonus insularis]|uniref:protein broad-minded-like n=1 Tax=Chelonus insularis TaxID=460826 RepID=UPI00158DF9F4|nr:protein broad-minded-like [Chelonus insularis]